MNFLHTVAIPGRTCGTCTACCLSTEVADLGKPRWTDCPHRCEPGRLVEIKLPGAKVLSVQLDPDPALSGVETPFGTVPAHGCAIYTDRPSPCRQFACLWVSGNLGNDSYRPDRLGVVVEVLMSPKYGPMYGVWETTPGALERPRVNYMIETLAGRSLVYCWPCGQPSTRKIVGPPHMVAQIHNLINQRIAKTGPTPIGSLVQP